MMNVRTNPNRASASVNAIPRNIVVRTIPAASGCRAMASTAFPTRYPMPMPGPMAPRPNTRPLPMTPTSPSTWATKAPTCESSSPMALPSLVLGVHGPGDVDGGQDREDVGLEHGHQHLEPDERDRQRERRDGERDRGRLGQQVRGPQEEDGQDQVAGHHVRQESDGQRERPNQERGDELDRRQEDVDRFGDPRREQCVLQIGGALGSDPGHVEQRPDEEGQEGGDGDTAVHRELDARDDPEEVADQDEREHRGQEGDPRPPLLADHLDGDLLADEVDDRLDKVPDASRNQCPATRRHDEEDDDDGRGQEHVEDPAVQAEVDAEQVPFRQAGWPEQLQSWGLEWLRWPGLREEAHPSRSLARSRSPAAAAAGSAGMRSAPPRPESTRRASKTSRASVPPTAAIPNTAVESTPVRSTRTRAPTITAIRRTKPPSATACITGIDTVAAHASERPWAAKFATTSARPRTADHAPDQPATANPTPRATGAASPPAARA